MVSLAPLHDLAAQLAAVEGVRTASVDPAELGALPAVWVQLSGIGFDRLAGHTLRARLVLVVADNGVERSAAALVALLNAVLTVVDPDDDVTFAPTLLPGNPGPLPSAAVPVDILI